MAHWSSGQDATLSRWNQEFDPPMGYQVVTTRTPNNHLPFGRVFRVV